MKPESLFRSYLAGKEREKEEKEEDEKETKGEEETE